MVSDICAHGKRGRHGQSKISQIAIDEIKNHINLFPANKSLFKGSWKYLSSDWSTSKMYK